MENKLDKTKLAIKVDTVDQAEEVVKWFGLPKVGSWKFDDTPQHNWIVQIMGNNLVINYAEIMLHKTRTKLTYAEWKKAIDREIVGYKQIKDSPFSSDPIGTVFHNLSGGFAKYPEFFEPVYAEPQPKPECTATKPEVMDKSLLDRMADCTYFLAQARLIEDKYIPGVMYLRAKDLLLQYEAQKSGQLQYMTSPGEKKEQDKPVVKWEYTSLYGPSEATLVARGNEGWEAYSTIIGPNNTDAIYYFKRIK